MAWLKRLQRIVEQDPELWFPGALFLGGSVGFVFWSWKITAAAISGLCLFLIIRRLRRLYPLVWCLLWALVWLEFGRSFLNSLERHPHFLDRLPTYAGSAICAYFWLGWMGTAVLHAKNKLGASQGAEPGGGETSREPEQDTPALAETPAAFDPYLVLEVPPDASPSQLKEAYRHQMALYHPDKVAHLGNDLQATASRKTLEIQLAYETLTAAQAVSSKPL